MLLFNVWQAVLEVVLMRNEELVILRAVSHRLQLEHNSAHTRCIVNRALLDALRAMNKKGLGAVCTAVLVKLRLPLISCVGVSQGHD